MFKIFDIFLSLFGKKKDPYKWTTCIKCGSEFATKDQEELCWVCQDIENLKKAQKIMKKLNKNKKRKKL